MDFNIIKIIGLLAIGLLLIFVRLVLPHLKDAWIRHRKMRFIKKHRATVIGEIVGMECEGRYALYDYLNNTGRRTKSRRPSYYVYSARVSYTVNGCTYETAANDYSLEEPVIGQKVYVHYKLSNPLKMYVGEEVREEGVINVGCQPSYAIAKQKARTYQTEIMGEVVGYRKKSYSNSALVPWLGPNLFKQELYSAIVRYRVLNTVYEIDAGDYSGYMPTVGDKALVLCDSVHPEKAVVLTWERTSMSIEVVECDNEFVYCIDERGERIAIPVYKVKGKVQPGNYLIQRYGCYR